MDTGHSLLYKEQMQSFNGTVVKFLLLNIITRHKFNTVVVFLNTRDTGNNEDNWNKLLCILGYLNYMIWIPLTL